MGNREGDIFDPEGFDMSKRERRIYERKRVEFAEENRRLHVTYIDPDVAEAFLAWVYEEEE